eukprot:ANDGO_05968.mRNA.1 hypothetical protein
MVHLDRTSVFGLLLFAAGFLQVLSLGSPAWMRYVHVKSELSCGLFTCMTRFPGYERYESVAAFASSGGEEDHALHLICTITLVLAIPACILSLVTALEIFLLRSGKLSARYERFLSIQALAAGLLAILGTLVYGVFRPRSSNDFTPYANTYLGFAFYMFLVSAALGLGAFAFRKHQLFAKRDILP